MEKGMSIIDTIFAEYNNFFDAEKKLADYIVKNTYSVIDMTISELSEAAGTSDATVSRFCKKCNMKGFHHLKITLAKELADSNKEPSKVSNDISKNSIGVSLNNILNNKIEELRQTILGINEEQFSEILEIIKKARTVQFAAVGNTIPVALDGCYKFNQLGIASVANTIWETQIAYTFNLSKEDVVIIISNTGESKRLISIADTASKNGAVTIAITNSDNSMLAKVCKYHIRTSTREKLFLDEYCFSRISAMTIIEILYLFLIAEKKDSYTNITNHEESIADDKV